jgi:hypothetical protein
MSYSEECSRSWDGRVVIFSLRGGFLTIRRFSWFNVTEGTGWPKGRIPQPSYARLFGEANHIIIIHLRGEAPAGCETSPDNVPRARYPGSAIATPGEKRVTGLRWSFQPAEFGCGKKPLLGERSRLKSGKGGRMQLTYPFPLSRPHLASVQLCSHLGFALGG